MQTGCATSQQLFDLSQGSQQLDAAAVAKALKKTGADPLHPFGVDPVFLSTSSFYQSSLADNIGKEIWRLIPQFYEEGV